MIQNLAHLKGMTIGAVDGAIGKIKDVFFDDSEWSVRYLVVETGSWLRGRNVLISPLCVKGVDWRAERVKAVLSRDQVKNSPDVDVHRPVRHDERSVGDSHLRSANEVKGYHIEALDGSLGHIEDFLVDDETGFIASWVVDTRSWLPGRHVMISPEWIEKVDWSDREARLTVDREAVRQQPEFPDALP